MRLEIPVLAVLAVLAAYSSCVLADSAAPVSSVVLYPGSATITRTAQIAAGTRQLVIGDLPANFDANTLRVVAPAGIRIGEIDTTLRSVAGALNPAVAELEAKILALQDLQAALDADIKASEIVTRYLENYNDSASGPGTADKTRTADPKALSGVIDTLGHAATDAFAKIQRMTVQKREIEKKITPLKHDLDRLQDGEEDIRSITVHMLAEKAGQIAISYQVKNAGWQPGYRAYLDSSTSKIELERLATISQKTGESWNNVTLALSTSKPRQSAVGREPQPWLLSYQPPVNNRGAAYAPAPALERVEITGSRMPKLAPGDPDYDAYTPPTFQTNGTFATEFLVPGRVNLPSDGREVSVTLSKQTLAARQYLRITPRLDAAAIVSAESERPAGIWPAGIVQLFRDGSYIGSAELDMQHAVNTTLSFGRDDMVQVAFNEVKGKSGTSGLFEKRGEKNIADAITVTNLHPGAVELLVLETSPVSNTDEITVKTVFEPKPSIENWEQRRGVVAWKSTLAGGQSAKFGVDYVISYPATGTVSGLHQ